MAVALRKVHVHPKIADVCVSVSKKELFRIFILQWIIPPRPHFLPNLYQMHLISISDMENSPKLESMPTSLWICHFTGRNHHFKMESHGNYKAAASVAHRRDISICGFRAIAIYLYTMAVSPSLGGSRQHKRNNKNNGGFTPFFQQWRRIQPSLEQ